VRKTIFAADRAALDAAMAPTQKAETPPEPQPADRPGTDTANRRRLLLLIAYGGFISLGLPDTVAGVAWPSVRDTFVLPQSGLGLVFLALGCGYCASSFFGGKLTLALGIGTLLTGSSFLVAIAMFGNALAPIWPVFVAGAVIWGLGSGAIDSGLNAYVASHFSARHVNWLHAFYSLGATLGPLLMTAMVVRAGSWRLGYALVGGVVLALTVAFLSTRRLWGGPPGPAAGEVHEPVSMGAALCSSLVWLQVVVFFLYTGLEFTAGQWAFTLFTESRAVRTDVAGLLAGSYFGAIGVGRLLFGAVADRIGVDRLVRWATRAALLGAALLAFGAPVEVSGFGLVVLGLGLAPIFPCLMARTPQRLGAGYATHAVGFQVSAAMLGAAVVPGLAGLLAQGWGLEVVARFAVLLAALLGAMHELLLLRARKRAAEDV
jgi:fucose permease